ncbi:MAG: S1 RNA-binding domain-containing protein [Eubacteriales bacterium]
MTDIFFKMYQPEGMLLSSPVNREYLSSPSGLERAMRTGRILEARAVLCDNMQNLIVDLGGIKGIIPREEAAMGAVSDGKVRDIAIITRVGKAVAFKVLAMDTDEQGQPIAILSRRAAQEETVSQYLMNLSPGDIIDAKVTHLEPFGCFVDIGSGFVSLLTIDCISVSRISHPRDRFTPGQYIKVVVKSVDRQNCKITLSHKELLGTWEENASRFTIGQTAAGVVRSVEPYGIFIELTPNLAGLAEFKENVATGQCAAVYIKNIIPERMKIKLVIIDSYQAECINKKMDYFITKGHIDRWKYSPDCCERVVESVFDEEQ